MPPKGKLWLLVGGKENFRKSEISSALAKKLTPFFTAQFSSYVHLYPHKPPFHISMGEWNQHPMPATPLVHLCTEPYSCALSPLLFFSPCLIQFSLSPRSFLLAYKDAVCCAKSLQSCLTLRNPMDHSPPGSSVHGILQARILEWVVVFSSRGPSQPRDQKIRVSCVSCIGRQILYPRATWEANAPLI